MEVEACFHQVRERVHQATGYNYATIRYVSKISNTHSAPTVISVFFRTRSEYLTEIAG